MINYHCFTIHRACQSTLPGQVQGNIFSFVVLTNLTFASIYTQKVNVGGRLRLVQRTQVCIMLSHCFFSFDHGLVSNEILWAFVPINRRRRPKSILLYFTGFTYKSCRKWKYNKHPRKYLQKNLLSTTSAQQRYTLYIRVHLRHLSCGDGTLKCTDGETVFKN